MDERAGVEGTGAGGGYVQNVRGAGEEYRMRETRGGGKGWGNRVLM